MSIVMFTISEIETAFVSLFDSELVEITGVTFEEFLQKLIDVRRKNGV